MINDKLMSFMCSRIPFGLKVFSSEYGILELESVSRDGMVELRGNNESSVYTQFFSVKPILYPAEMFLNDAVVCVSQSTVKYVINGIFPYFTDQLGFVNEGLAVSVFDLPFDPYMKYDGNQFKGETQNIVK